MIQLTEKVIAVEVPNDLPVEKFEVVQTKGETRLYGYGELDLIGIWHLFDWIEDCSLVGVTPLSEEQWKEVVKTEVVGIYDEDDNIERYDYLYKNYSNPRDYNKLTATGSGLSLLESKGLDINKKYAIIKIEKVI